MSNGGGRIDFARHVLGLFHEHQRYDAPEYINLDCRMIPNYQVALAAYTAQGNQFTEQRFLDEVCTSWAEAVRLSTVWPAAVNYIPQQDLGYQNYPFPYVRDFKVTGGFDWGSVMLYPSQNIMSRKWDGGQWGLNYHPSRGIDGNGGDIGAVKQLYPDI